MVRKRVMSSIVKAKCMDTYATDANTIFFEGNSKQHTAMSELTLPESVEVAISCMPMTDQGKFDYTLVVLVVGVLCCAVWCDRDGDWLQ